MPVAIVYVDTAEHATELEQFLESWLRARHPAHGEIDVIVQQDPLVYLAQGEGADSTYVFASESARDDFLLLKDWANPSSSTEALLDTGFVHAEAASMITDSEVGQLLVDRGVDFNGIDPNIAIDVARWWGEFDVTRPQPDQDADLDAKANELIDVGWDAARTERRRRRRLAVVRQEARERVAIYQSGDPATGRHWITAEVRDAFGAVRGQVRVEDNRPGWIDLSQPDSLVADVSQQAVDEAVAGVDFAIKLDWALQYKDTNPEAARYLEEHEGDI